MAEGIFLVTKSNANHNQTVNGILAVLINADDAAGTPAIIAAAVAAAERSYVGSSVNSSFRTGYFDSVLNVADLLAGPLKDAGDAFVFAANTVPRKVEGL